MARQPRRAPGHQPPLTAWATGAGATTIAVLTYQGVSTTEAELPARALGHEIEATVVFVSVQGGPVYGVEPGRVVSTVPLATARTPTAVVVPGGLGWRGPAEDPETIDWIRTAVGHARGVLTVSTGSLVLAATGLISGEATAGHWLGGDLMNELGAEATTERVTTTHDDAWYTTSGTTAAVSAAKQLGGRIRWAK